MRFKLHWGQSVPTLKHSIFGIEIGAVFIGIVIQWTLD